ncbi:hypothetical protein NEMBOFW57_003617 [Staphylotrichum longicolle]|uniref:Heterokaryon incompatibility domain-containing protein n=1 Tax=Staphylotrichum longicolle TaxID=669026 RepID=A0AAD4F5L2_9PEZI|nr:hypothetical protein NEMBOFW57_003617 [Staphylotrichum longicolle]
MAARPTARPEAALTASGEVDDSHRNTHDLTEERRNICGQCNKVVEKLKPSMPNASMDFGIDGEGGYASWDVAKVNDSAKSCDLCRVLVEMFNLGPSDSVISFGTITGKFMHLEEHYTLAANLPPGPRPDVRRLENWSLVQREVGQVEDDQPKMYQSWTLGRQLVMSYSKGRGREGPWESKNGPAAPVEEGEGEPKPFNSIQIARSDSNPSRLDPENAFFVRQISSRRQNIPLIRSWLDRCLEEHEGECQSSSGRPTNRSLSLRVIDVEARCVVKAPHGCRYLALSYVWGNARQVLLKRTNRKAFSRPGGLPDGIPQTIEDAMALCRMLGERYLWVDALCIYQDPPPEKSGMGIQYRVAMATQAVQQRQIRNMDAIYSGTVLTISNAAARSADDPIPGVRSDAPRRVPLPSAQIGENMQIAATVADVWEHVSSHSQWDTRGWTFQEKILSKRLLVVTDSFSFFRCPSMLWREDRFEADLFKETDREKAQVWASMDGRGLHRVTPSSNSQELAKRTLDEYQKLVQLYVTRRFTYDKDVLLAFQGIEQTMKPSVGDFFWGLPKRAFNAALAWEFTGQPRRREGFPSWSWAGWEGRADGRLRYKDDIHEHIDEKDGRIAFYRLVARRPMRRLKGELPLSLTKVAVDISIINKSPVGGKYDHIQGSFRSGGLFQPRFRPPQPGPPTWQAVAERLGQPSRLLIDRLDQVLVFYSMAIEADPLSASSNFGYWAPNEQAAGGGLHCSSPGSPQCHRDSPTTALRPRDWIVVQHFGGKYLTTMLIEWVDNVAYRIALNTRVRTSWFLGELGTQMKLIILG